ncbi:alpha/beta fold hydrolase [Streptomyces sp. TBY4]|uniref:alpha/beta fold hydrolase n=1 Tax=Streptomyces sp. TBY4 TaxID=2962030 RepID=UPI0020B8EEE9|nr:alpha/beta hydrolase [Streptomyces sp. TBY4]MCP3757020.1 alpha/beta hydrolase [Streptomyces sp. TBY4]
MTAPASQAGAATGASSGDALAHALLDTASVLRAGTGRLRVAPTAPVSAARLPALQSGVDRLARALGLPGPELVATPDGLTAPELAVGRRLAVGTTGTAGRPAHAGDAAGLDLDDRGVAEAAHRARTAFPGPPVVLPARDGTLLRCWAAGPPDAPAVAVVGACGMPVGLTVNWLAALSSRYRVVTWESRGLFASGECAGLGGPVDHSVEAQSEDLLAVLDGFGIDRAHALGLCGGAVVALAAAARSERIDSLSLWHGDWELGGEAPKTTHQRDMESLLAMVARGPNQAAAMHRLLSRPSTLDGLRPDRAHYLIHPYATPELLYRYGQLNGTLMTTDCRRLLTTHQPALVVTSDRDTTAHPAGSVYVARHLPAAELRTLPDGDHLGAFDAKPALVTLAEEFLHSVTDHPRKDT